MVAVADHHKKLALPYSRKSKAVEVIRSAKNLAKLILQSDDLIPAHQRRILSEVLWFLSEADGKYFTRFRTVEVVRLAKEDSTSQVVIQHEHVYPREKVSSKLLGKIYFCRANPEALELLLDETVGCIVTNAEHDFLLKNKEGWARYRDVPVYDMSSTLPKLLPFV